MSINPKDMEFQEGKNSAARDIALAFGVPPQLLGIPGDSTFANYEQAKLAFWTETVLPLLATILEGYNRWLVPLYDENQFLWYDEEMIPALEPLRKAKADRINAAAYLTIDEKRAAMGYDTYKADGTPGGTILVPSANIPLELRGLWTSPPRSRRKNRKRKKTMPIDVFDHLDSVEIRIRPDRIVTDGERGAVSYTTLLDNEEVWEDAVIVRRRGRPRKSHAD